MLDNLIYAPFAQRRDPGRLDGPPRPEGGSRARRAHPHAAGAKQYMYYNLRNPIVLYSAS